MCEKANTGVVQANEVLAAEFGGTVLLGQWENHLVVAKHLRRDKCEELLKEGLLVAATPCMGFSVNAAGVAR